ncbi:MAG: YciI family protein [Acidimicrobiia bacterium]
MKLLLLAGNKPGAEGVALRDTLREAHMEGVTARFNAGEVLLGAGIYDDEGVVRGSVMVLDMPSREAVDAYLRTEPFQVGGLWDHYEVTELKQPDMYTERLGPAPKS